MRTITLNPKQQRRADVLSRLEAGNLTDVEAASLLQVSLRHIRRLRNSYKESSLAGLVHGNTGRSPANQLDAGVRETILDRCGPDGPYHDFNVCHAKDMLKEHHGIVIGRSTLDRLLKETGVRMPRRKNKVVRRSRRERVPAEGQMLQVDGSPHDWLEGRGPRMCLMGAIDDATGKIIHLRFHKTESQAGYLLLLRSVCKEHGVPMSIYHDKHTILRSPKEQTIEEELSNEKPMSEVQRVMDSLGVESIAAHSPQAKGRVERMWRTLQDRLLKEMRLAGIRTMEEANAFLPGFIERHNEQRAVEPADTNPAWIPLEEDADLDRLFSTRELRTVSPDHTVSVSGKRWLLLRGKADTSLVGRKVAVHATIEGNLCFYDGKERIEAGLCPEPTPAKPEHRDALAGLGVPQNLLDALKPQKDAFTRFRGHKSATTPTETVANA
jgi:transposase